jgi:hypothetical protein
LSDLGKEKGNYWNKSKIVAVRNAGRLKKWKIIYKFA